MQRPGRRTRQQTAEPTQQLLAIIEAELGALLDFLPAPLVVTSQTGEILRANRAAVLFLDAPEPIIHKPLTWFSAPSRSTSQLRSCATKDCPVSVRAAAPQLLDTVNLVPTAPATIVPSVALPGLPA